MQQVTVKTPRKLFKLFFIFCFFFSFSSQFLSPQMASNRTFRHRCFLFDWWKCICFEPFYCLCCSQCYSISTKLLLKVIEVTNWVCVCESKHLGSRLFDVFEWLKRLIALNCTLGNCMKRPPANNGNMSDEVYNEPAPVWPNPLNANAMVYVSFETKPTNQTTQTTYSIQKSCAKQLLGV